jgi:phosphonate transport system ATP-binding protein
MPALMSWFQLFPREDIDAARECLRRVELEHKADVRTDTLSGGQKQRVGIARALAQHPKVILADEPVASLDPKTSRKVLRYLQQASRDSGITVICNLHQVDYACEFAQRVIGVAAGRIVFEGHPRELTDEVLQRIYPGGFETPVCTVPEDAQAPATDAATKVATPAVARTTPELALEQP